MTMRGWRSLLPIIVFTALYAAVSLNVTNSYYQLVMTLVPVWAVFGLSWNLLSVTPPSSASGPMPSCSARSISTCRRGS